MSRFDEYSFTADDDTQDIPAWIAEIIPALAEPISGQCRLEVRKVVLAFLALEEPVLSEDEDYRRHVARRVILARTMELIRQGLLPDLPADRVAELERHYEHMTRRQGAGRPAGSAATSSYPH